MRIIEEPAEIYGGEVVEIISARYIGDFAIRIKFNSGVEKLVDFKPFLENSKHPSIRKFLDERLFQGFAIVDGNLNWNNYDLLFPIGDLLEGKIT
jgi:hypothetical protein